MVVFISTGERLWSDPPRFVDTIADGIRFQQVGHLTFPIMCRLVEKQVFTVVSIYRMSLCNNTVITELL